jgi:hypothetical protein
MDHAKLLSQMNFSFLCIVVSLYCASLLAAIAACGSSFYYTSLWIVTLQHHPFLYCGRNWKQNLLA